MGWHVDAWNPAYGTAFEGGPAPDSTPEVDAAVELPASAWVPLDPPPSVRAPDVVLLVDGVRRIDASLWSGEIGGRSFPALAERVPVRFDVTKDARSAHITRSGI